MGGVLVSAGCEYIGRKRISQTHYSECALGSPMASRPHVMLLPNKWTQQTSLLKKETLQYEMLCLTSEGQVENLGKAGSGIKNYLAFSSWGGFSITLEEKLTAHHVSSKLLFLR